MLAELFHKVTQVIQRLGCCWSNRNQKADGPRGNSWILALHSVACDLKASNEKCIDTVVYSTPYTGN